MRPSMITSPSVFRKQHWLYRSPRSIPIVIDPAGISTVCGSVAVLDNWLALAMGILLSTFYQIPEVTRLLIPSSQPEESHSRALGGARPAGPSKSGANVAGVTAWSVAGASHQASGDSGGLVATR